MWTVGTDPAQAATTSAPLVRVGTCSSSTTENIILREKKINYIPPDAFAACGTPKALDLSYNNFTSISGVAFPPSLTHLSLKNNLISSISGLTISLTTCSGSDAACTLLNYTHKTVDLSANLLTSIHGAIFSGTIVTLKLGSGGEITKKKLESLPIGATFPASLTILDFDVDTDKVWTTTSKYCNGVVPGSFSSSLDPTTCCLWGGKKIFPSGSSPELPSDRPLERIGTCTSAQYATNGVLDLRDANTPVNGITRILPNAFSNCGSPDVLLLDNHKIQTLANVAFPISLKILSLKNNLVDTLSGAGLTNLTNLTLLKVLDLEQNKLKSIPGVLFPTSLTCASLSRPCHLTRFSIVCTMLRIPAICAFAC